MNNDEFILRRPSQLVQMQETVGGTENDQLKNARRDLLGKLSKPCAFLMVHEQTPLGSPILDSFLLSQLLAEGVR